MMKCRNLENTVEVSTRMRGKSRFIVHDTGMLVMSLRYRNDLMIHGIFNGIRPEYAENLEVMQDDDTDRFLQR